MPTRYDPIYDEEYMTCNKHHEEYPCPICTPSYCEICKEKFSEDKPESWQAEGICEECFEEMEDD
jgi:hypothetical protein